MSRYTNTPDVPLSLAVFLASDSYDYNSDPNTVSCTTLLKPVRQVILANRLGPEDGAISLPDQMSNRMGAAVHDAIERAWLNNYRPAMQALGYPQRVIDMIRINPTLADLAIWKAQGTHVVPIYMEQRLQKKVGKWTVTGKFDFVGEGRVQDFKTASVWSYMNQVNATKQTQQGSIYRWLGPELITQDEMDIIHIFMDWKAGMVKTDPKYPPQRFKKQTFPLLSVAETDAFIRNKLRLIEKYWDAPEEEIPECDAEDLWRSEPVFKYYKSGQVGPRSTKNFDSVQDARIRFIEDGSVGLIKEIPGQVTACKYCPAFAACSQKDALISAGELLMA